MGYEGSKMKHIIETIEVTENCIYLIDPDREAKVKIAETLNGEDLSITTSDGSYLVVDSKLFLGSLKALTTKNERDRLNKR